MPCLFHCLLNFLAGSPQDNLRRQIQYLKAENEVLRSKISGPVRVLAYAAQTLTVPSARPPHDNDTCRTELLNSGC
jgi:hypothetical protein